MLLLYKKHMKTTVSVRLHNAGSHWQSLCHVCLQCIEGKHWAKMQYYRNCVLKKDIRNKPSKAPISNHIYCTLICDLQLFSTKLHCFFISWVGHLNTMFVPRCNSCSVAKKHEKCPRNGHGQGRRACLKLTEP